MVSAYRLFGITSRFSATAVYSRLTPSCASRASTLTPSVTSIGLPFTMIVMGRSCPKTKRPLPGWARPSPVHRVPFAGITQIRFEGSRPPRPPRGRPRRPDPVPPQPLPRCRAQALIPKREPPLPLGRMVGQHVLEAPEGAPAVEDDGQPVAQPFVAHRRHELRHPAVLNRRRRRLDVNQMAFGETVLDLVHGKLVVFQLVPQRERLAPAHLAGAQVKVRLPLVASPRERHLEVVPVDRNAPARSPLRFCADAREDARARGLVELVAVEAEEQRLPQRGRRG